MNMVIKDIPREYLALKINFCRQQLEMLPEVKLSVHNINGTPTQKLIIGNQRYKTDSAAGSKLMTEYKIREYYVKQLRFFEMVWDNKYKDEPPAECKPHAVKRKLFIGNTESVVMDRDFFNGLENDCDTKYAKPKYYHFNGIYYRSAAEREIAMYYTEMGIPFKYEPAIFLKGLSKPIFPDFVIYIRELNNCKIHEHFGVRDSAQYLSSTKYKYENYTGAGLVPETDIIFTHDVDDMPFDMRAFISKLNTAIYTTAIGP